MPGLDTEHHLVERARQRALGLLQDRSGPFANPWTAWSPDPAWPLPVLPDGVDTTTLGIAHSHQPID
ncbi:hypothetical protein OG689_42725 [Kitasatospora sp. NBC_00240]|uniref:hypothetical protein n=1 Tax=Kitasatospora sp. NBC_00240 TaxID=2903567 RepID=UPI00224F85DB|nr:hypothetical protein [Kitasatospora sp. NBC_00240]MCX5215864.1 hypothetical protein [Kitasatospora sp. NBC_00240]